MWHAERLLQQDFRSGVEKQEEREGRKSGGYDIEIERMVLSLPYSTTNDVRVRAALQFNTSVCLRGDLAARLLRSLAKDGKEALLGQALQWLSALDGGSGVDVCLCRMVSEAKAVSSCSGVCWPRSM